jgi:hypothetical protein
MFKWIGSRIFWGLLLIAGGVLFLLQTLFNFEFGGLFWALVFGLGGTFFVSWFFQDRQQWWALIPGFTLLSIGLIILIGILAPALSGAFSGFIILGGIGASFLLIYFLRRDFWWALIPAGTLLTLGVVALLSDLIPGLEVGAVFFLGLAATFALLTFVPTDEGRMKWPWIPAGILGGLALIVLMSAGNLAGIAVPVVLILAGLFLVARNFLAR